MSQPGGSLERFDPPEVQNAPIERFDEQGLGQEPNNLAAIHSLTTYRTLRWGRYLELLITDQHTYRAEVPDAREEARPLNSNDFPELAPQEMLEILDAGRGYAGGRPLEQSPGADGGPLRYRVVHRVPMWRPGERPRLEQRVLEGDPGLAL